MKRRISLIAYMAVFAMVLIEFGAYAAAPKFFSATSSVNSSGALIVNFDERGLGNENVSYTLTSDATALYACINGGGKNPSAANKRSFEGQVVGGGSFEVKNGRVIASLAAGPLSAGAFSCPGGQRLRLASVSYTNIVLSDSTNDVSTRVADASRTFQQI